MSLAKPYGKFAANALGGETAGESTFFDYLSDTIRVMLCTSTYIPNKDTHEFKSDITNEVVGAGYTARGVALGSKTNAYDAANDRVLLDAADALWAAATLTARYAIIYKDSGVDSTSPLIAYVDFEVDKSVAGVDFSIVWSASGILALNALDS